MRCWLLGVDVWRWRLSTDRHSYNTRQ